MELMHFVFDPIFGSVPPDWQEALCPFFTEAEAHRLSSALLERYAQGEEIFPPRNLIFNSLCQTPFERVRAVIIGQDPYHEPGQAMGLCFAVPTGVRLPPSLRNIFQEYSYDLGLPPPINSTLLPWAAQGVLLLNNVLTVSSHRAGSHRNMGWEEFTAAVIRAVSAKPQPVAFLLFGNDAIRAKRHIDCTKNIVFETAHPSPLSAYRGFFGSRPFTTVNMRLRQWGLPEIDWRL